MIKIERQDGLIVGLEYKTRPDNSIDWKALVPLEYLYLNPQRATQIEKKYRKKIAEINIIEDKVEDQDLIITLVGLKYLLKVRGYTSLNYNIFEANESYAAVSCYIQFIGNIETESAPVLFSDNACAHPGNTKSFGRNYLLEIATNRAFCRTVRNFLNIAIVSKEELGEEGGSENLEEIKSNSSFLIDNLHKRMVKHGYTFDQIKSKLLKEDPEAQKWESLLDLPPKWLVICIERIDQKHSKVPEKKV